ncbi:DUF1990 family protein [Nonomuraea recticatena]|uniref:DUF1990 domain-containing protein n=1 Tax=Nonomuraea recticatena TaxID=46178 RepID=A0ABP6FRX8_9ACTN
MEFTYPDVGATLTGDLPAGYTHLRHSRVLRVPFEEAAEALMTWQVQHRLGMRPLPSAPRVAPGVKVTVHLAVLKAPCGIVWVIEEQDRAGWAYGTLPGHPESGEESFLLERLPDGRAKVTITVFSRPGSLLTRLGGPLVTLTQRLFLRLYARALDLYAKPANDKDQMM